MAGQAGARWEKRLERWRRSGQTAAAFCRAEGVSATTFYAWRRRLGEPRSDEAQALEFVELPAAAESSAPIMLEVGDVTVHLQRGVDGVDLATVLAALEARR